jgi:hypothetical protein
MEVHEAIHYHHIGWIWVLFVSGLLVHWLGQIWRLGQDSKTTMRRVLCVNWVPMVVRSFACSLIFAAIWQHPQMIAAALKFIGHPISADEAAVFAWPMNNVISGAYGFGLDSLVGYIPILKSQMLGFVTTEVKKTVTLSEVTQVSQPEKP